VLLPLLLCFSGLWCTTPLGALAFGSFWSMLCEFTLSWASHLVLSCCSLRGAGVVVGFVCRAGPVLCRCWGSSCRVVHSCVSTQPAALRGGWVGLPSVCKGGSSWCFKFLGLLGVGYRVVVGKVHVVASGCRHTQCMDAGRRCCVTSSNVRQQVLGRQHKVPVMLCVILWVLYLPLYDVTVSQH
jgi:hypothetical protein